MVMTTVVVVVVAVIAVAQEGGGAAEAQLAGKEFRRTCGRGSTVNAARNSHTGVWNITEQHGNQHPSQALWISKLAGAWI